MKRTITTLLALATVAAAPLAASADSYQHGASGIISSVNGGAVTLRSGQTIFLNGGTQISPSGQSLQAGERISVVGADAGDGNVNARAIRIFNNDGGYANGGYGYGNGGGYGNGRYDRRSGYDNGSRGRDTWNDRGRHDDRRDNRDNRDNRNNGGEHQDER